jgi:hypothetical protein
MYNPKTYAILEKAPFSEDLRRKIKADQEENPKLYRCPHHNGEKPKLTIWSTHLACSANGCNYTQDWAYGETLTI